MIRSAHAFDVGQHLAAIVQVQAGDDLAHVKAHRALAQR